MLGSLLKLKTGNVFEELTTEDGALLSILDRILDMVLDAANSGHSVAKGNIVLPLDCRKPEVAGRLAGRAEEALKEDKGLQAYSIGYRDGENVLRAYVAWEIGHG